MMMNWLSSFLRNRSRCLILLLVLVTGLATHTSLQSSGLRATDDNLIFYLSGLKVFHGEALDKLNDRAIAHYTQQAADQHAMMRLKLHKVGLNEYVLPGTIYYGVSRILKPLYDPAPGLYPIFLTQSIVFGFYLTFLLTLLVLVGVFSTIAEQRYSWAMALTIGIYGLSELLPVDANSFATILMHNSLGDTLAHIRDLILRPGPQFSPLSFPTRSNFSLLILALFALRWQGRYAAAYALLFFMSFYHLSASGLLIVMLVGIDLLRQPEIFRQRNVAAAVGVLVAVFLYREEMWGSLLGHGLMPVIAAGVGTVVFIGLTFIPAVRKVLFGPRSFYGRLQQMLRARSAVAADLILVVTGWLVTVVAVYFMLKGFNLRDFDSWASAFYFWGRVNGRVMTLLMPSVIFGCLVLLLARLERGNFPALDRHGYAVFPLILAAIAIATTWQARTRVDQTTVLPVVAAGYFQIERALSGGPLPQLKAMGVSETILYYGFSKSVDGHPRDLDAVLP